MSQSETARDLRHNLIVHVTDSGSFGLGIGLASLVTVIPLFVRELTDSRILIGLVAAMFPLGWHLPQLLTVRRSSRATRLLPVAVRTTFHERWPFLALAVLAWQAPRMDPRLVLAVTFLLVLWFGIGGGLTAPPFQTMVGKIVPPGRLGAFYGAKAGAATLMAGLGAVIAGLVLQRLAWPASFAACFLLAFVAVMVSWGLLALTREPEGEPAGGVADGRAFWSGLWAILRRDRDLRMLLVARSLSQLALMGQAFLTVYVVGRYGVTPAAVGVMTAVFMVSQTVANPFMGWLGDRWRHRRVMALGAVAAAMSALMALSAPSADWFLGVFALAGVASVAMIITPLAMILGYSPVTERPAYIGLSNTLVAPAAILAPVLGGWLADHYGYGATFLVAALGGLVTAAVLVAGLRDPGGAVGGVVVEVEAGRL